MEEMQQHQPTEVKPPRKPWGRNVLIGMSLVGGTFFAGGIIAAINWRRMGRPRLFWATLLATISFVIGSIIVLSIYPGLGEVIGQNTAPSMLLNMAAACLLWSCQKFAYQSWIKAHPDARKPGWFAPAGIVIFLILVGLLFAMAKGGI
jgi:hypothetical protein